MRVGKRDSVIERNEELRLRRAAAAYRANIKALKDALKDASAEIKGQIKDYETQADDLDAQANGAARQTVLAGVDLSPAPVSTEGAVVQLKARVLTSKRVQDAARKLSGEQDA